MGDEINTKNEPIVFHRYNSFLEYINDLGQETLLPCALSIVNMVYFSDLVLLYPPPYIALAAIHLSANAEMFKKVLDTWNYYSSLVEEILPSRKNNSPPTKEV